METSVSRGPGTPALLEETIGGCLRRIAGEFGEREARSSMRRSTGSHRDYWRRASTVAIGSGSGARTAPSGR